MRHVWEMPVATATAALLLLSLAAHGDGPEKGACCINFECFQLTFEECNDAGGLYFGDGALCYPTLCIGFENCAGGGPCGQPAGTPGCNGLGCCQSVCTIDPFCCQVAWDQNCVDLAFDVCTTGACCVDGQCVLVISGECSGEYQGDGVDCTPGLCDVPTGACCIDGQCVDDLTEDACLAQGGVYQFDGTVCGDSVPNGVCQALDTCLPDAGPCGQANGTPGCAMFVCCINVCVIEPFCCEVEWDESCVELAIEICGLGPPVNDACPDRLPIVDGATPYSTIFATTDGVAHAGCQFDGQTYHDVWYNYTATCDGPLTISTCNAADYDTDLAVYATCDVADCPPGDADLIACSDDFPGCAGFTSEVTFDAVCGACYKIRVGGWNDGDQGTGTLTITCNGDCGDPCPCEWDLDGDCDVDPADLAALLAAWNNPYGAADLAALLAEWGCEG